jgi:6-phosphogluconolactonase/glucosamine-6-phosphate isomerase/deaminase
MFGRLTADLVHLGLGPDGHTASLVPGDPVLDITDELVATTGAYQGRRRMTLTYPALARAGQILWLVTGEDKKTPLARLLAGDRSIPAGRSGRHTCWYSPTRRRPEPARGTAYYPARRVREPVTLGRRGDQRS